MTIDDLLTSRKARRKIGEFIRINDETSRSLRTIKKDIVTNPLKNYKLDYDSRNLMYDITWTFNSGSELAHALEGLRKIQHQQGMRNPNNDTEEAHSRLTNAMNWTGLRFILNNYSFQMNDYIFVEGGMLNREGSSIREGVYNAIEHGTDYCRNGEVKVRFLGGEKGAVVFVEQRGKGFELKQMPDEQLEKYRSESARLQNDGTRMTGRYGLPYHRGCGLAVFSETRKAIIGSERDGEIFRLIVLYPLPKKIVKN